jgi:hypothetical protein
MSNNNLPLIEKLRGRENYNTWQFGMKTYLELEGLWSCVDGSDETTPEDAKLKRDIKAKSKIILMIETTNYIHVQNVTTAKEVWEKLKTTFHDSGLTRKVNLIRNMITTKLENCDSIESYVNQIMTTSQKLNEIKFEITDEWLATFLLAGLSEEYKPMIMALENSGIQLTADSVKTKLLQEVKQKSSSSVALFNKGKKKHFHKYTPRCYNCNNYGHLAKDCTVRKKTNFNHPPSSSNRKPTSLFSSVDTMNETNTWYIDSGASAHMTRNKNWLTNLNNSSQECITVANNQQISVKGVGDTNVKFGTDTVNIKNVLYVPDLRTNLLSVSQTVKKGNSVLFNSSGCKIFDSENELIATAKLVNNMYKLDCTSDKAFSVETDHNLWHRRLGHLNYEYMNKLQNLVAPNSNVKFKSAKDKCEICVKGKQTKIPNKNVGIRATQLLELIHSDLCGPIEISSLGGAQYFLTFIDDYSHKAFIYILKSKDEVTECFIKFKNFVENQVEKKIKILRTDNGGEYCSNYLNSYLEKAGIQHQLTAPYTPEQNGVAERLNRSIVEKVRCMLFDAKLPKEFWAEAAATAVYLMNRSPSRSIDNRIPEEIWTKRQVDINHLRIFGCKAYMHIPKEKRRKLDNKAQECIFVGYSLDTKGYRLYRSETKETFISRNVTFFEDSMKEERIKNVKLDYNFQDNTDEVGDNSENIHNGSEGGSITDIDTTDQSESSSIQSINDPDYIADIQQNVDMKLRRSTRPPQPKKFDDNYLYSVTSNNLDDPLTVEEALHRPDAQCWKEAMMEEYESLLENQTWSLTNLPDSKRVINSKWIFKTKYCGPDKRYKARLVIKGCSQKPGVDYDETFAPVVRYSSIRYLLSQAAKHDLDIEQMDAVTAFLQGDLNEEIYMTPPEGFMTGKKVCRLNKALYGLKQASRAWNKKLHAALLEIGLHCSKADQCVYYKINSTKMIYVAVYVDDLLIFSNDNEMKLKLKDELSKRFKMKDIGQASYILGFHITRDRKQGKIWIDQEKYGGRCVNKGTTTDETFELFQQNGFMEQRNQRF